VYVDLERFKQVNDLYGHAAGDRLLVTAADVLRDVVRSVDQVGRLGGDEFLMICPHVENSARALEIGQRITGAVHTDVDVGQVWSPWPASVRGGMDQRSHRRRHAHRSSRLGNARAETQRLAPHKPVRQRPRLLQHSPATPTI
jgi:GGDEF domain-containing protein